MPITCAVLHCNHNSLNRKCSKDLHFPFPKNNDIIFEWVRVSGNTRLLDKSFSYIKKCQYMCACHFEEDFDIDVNGKKKLKPTAIPTLNLSVMSLPDTLMDKLRDTNENIEILKNTNNSQNLKNVVEHNSVDQLNEITLLPGESSNETAQIYDKCIDQVTKPALSTTFESFGADNNKIHEPITTNINYQELVDKTVITENTNVDDQDVFIHPRRNSCSDIHDIESSIPSSCEKINKKRHSCSDMNNMASTKPSSSRQLVYNCVFVHPRRLEMEHHHTVDGEVPGPSNATEKTSRKRKLSTPLCDLSIPPTSGRLRLQGAPKQNKVSLSILLDDDDDDDDNNDIIDDNNNDIDDNDNNINNNSHTSRQNVTTGFNHLEIDEVNIISGALELRNKTVSNVMTKIEDVYMLDYNAILDFKTVSDIMKSGYSRIPVFEGIRNNIITMLYITDLAFVDPDDNTPLKTLCQHYQNPCNLVFEDVTLDVMFKQFKEGHMAFVRKVNNEGKGDPFYEVIGLVTLEDVFQELIEVEIMNETDVFTNNNGSKRKRLTTQSKMPDFRVFAEKKENLRFYISPQLTFATFQYLSTTVDLFKPELISKTILRSLLNCRDIIHRIKVKSREKARNNPLSVIYQQGKPVDYFVLILEGRVEVTFGRNNLMFESGPFTSFGSQALSVNVNVAAESPLNANSQKFGSIQSINLDAILRHTFVPDYTVRAITEIQELSGGGSGCDAQGKLDLDDEVASHQAHKYQEPVY